LGVRGPEAIYAARAKRLVANDRLEQCTRVVVELPRRRVVEQRGKLSLQVPGAEEKLPVDVVDELADSRLDEARPDERRGREVVERDARAVGAGLGQREQRPLDLLGVLTAQPLLLLAVLRVERRAARGVEQARDHVD